MSSPLSILSIQSFTGKVLIASKLTSRSIGYTSTSSSAWRFGLGIGFASSAAACIFSREGMEIVDAAMDSRTMEAMGSKAVLERGD